MPSDGAEFPCGAVFFIRFRRLTRLTLRYFISAWYHHRCVVKQAIDALCSDLPEEFYIPLSSAYSWLSVVREWCRRRAFELGFDPNGLRCLVELKRAPEDLVASVIEHEIPRNLLPP